MVFAELWYTLLVPGIWMVIVLKVDQVVAGDRAVVPAVDQGVEVVVLDLAVAVDRDQRHQIVVVQKVERDEDPLLNHHLDQAVQQEKQKQKIVVAVGPVHRLWSPCLGPAHARVNVVIPHR